MMLTPATRYVSLPLFMLFVSIAGRAAADGRVESAEDRYPAYVLETPPSVTEILIADASSASLWRFEFDDGAIVERDQRYMSIGQNGVGKQRAWDRKTPLGVYFITEQLDTSRMHEKYGVTAFPLDYPNAWDKRNSRTGDGIWLHGVDRRKPDRPARDTDGCLSVPNEALLRLAETLEPRITPVIVARALTWMEPADVESRRQEFRRVLDTWRQSQVHGDLLTYLALYDKDFTIRGMDKAEWSTYRMNVFAARELDALEMNDLLLLADPEVPELYLSRFTQVLQTARGPVTTVKRLYWRREQENNWQIVAEDTG